MSKCLILSDLHMHLDLLDKVDRLLTENPRWHCVSLGDWFDDWGRPLSYYQTFLTHFRTFLAKYPKRLHLIWGNHDYGYWDYPAHHSGYSPEARDDIRDLLWKIYPRTYIAYKQDNVIFSHAGLTKGIYDRYLDQAHNFPHQSFIEWCDNLTPQELWDESSPLWHRPQNNYHKNTFNPEFLQVVGHTPVPTIAHTKEDNILYTDTWSTDSNYQPLGDHSLAVVDTRNQSWEIIRD